MNFFERTRKRDEDRAIAEETQKKILGISLGASMKNWIFVNPKQVEWDDEWKLDPDW